MKKKVVLDTETTGLEVGKGHRIIEIACMQLDEDDKPTEHIYNRRVNPKRLIDPGATSIHGIKIEDLENEPTFAEIYFEFLDFVKDAVLIIHNAPFDLGFLQAELDRLPDKPEPTWIDSIDTLAYSKRLKEDKRIETSGHSLDALCDCFKIDRSGRNLKKGEFHNALLDVRLLAELYWKLDFHDVEQQDFLKEASATEQGPSIVRTIRSDRPPGIVIRATEEELKAHEEVLQLIEKESKGKCLWLHQ
jgi:DNA polymerase-3 subunit epsilon